MLEVTTPEGKKTLEAGAVLVATGSGRYTPTEYPYGKTPSIIDQWELADRIGEGKTDAKKVVMIQCVGARDSEHPYCSRYCCKQAISNALLYKSNNPEAEVTILHKGIRVFGFEEDLYTDALEQGVNFISMKDRPEILADTGLKVRAGSEAQGRITRDADLVVLSLAHLHGPGQKGLAEVLGASLDDLGFFACRNPLTDPFKTTAEQVFVCGFARQPVVAEEAFTEGVGAAGAIWSALMM
jgi:heterodisulfide reductase subunit A